jgi:hypothetical protein
MEILGEGMLQYEKHGCHKTTIVDYCADFA